MGFPTRFLRSFLGPKLVNSSPVESPEQDVGDATFNALFWQTSGMNLVVPRASVIATYTGGQFVVAHQGEAWNADGAVAHPTLARAGAGSYSYTFLASYPDENGTAVPTELHTPRVTCHRDLSGGFANRIIAEAWKDAGNPLVMQVRLWDTGGAGVDHPFWLEVF